MKFKTFILINLLVIIIVSCSHSSKSEERGNQEGKEIESAVDSTGNFKENISAMKPDEMLFLVEGAVDTWFFYNLDNYASYQPIIRNTEYDSIRNLHVHYIRYRTMNKEGGYETFEKRFEVSFTLDEKGLPDFKVNEIQNPQ